MRLRYAVISLLAGLPIAVHPAIAADDRSSSDQGLRFFESRVRPVLVKHCYECHSAQSGTSESGLRLDSRPAMRTGGDRGPAVVPRKPDQSLLLTAVSHSDPDLRMPPGGRRLPDSVIADLKRWIELGAADPRDEAKGGATSLRRAGRDFWAYRKPRKPDVPVVANDKWPRQELDRFILAAQTRHDLSPSLDATNPVLLRRLHFDLIGLPPSPESMTRFEQRIADDGIDNALAAEVDELLASPQFGERWGRHWLDVARFGESSGKDANISFPYAWRYRDYVIDCVNADVPYDRFLMEQLAGDLLPYESAPERARLLIATGFLAIGTKNLNEMNALQFLADVVDEQIDTVTRAVVGSSVACARCHDHKFDAFSMADYYALAGIFASTKTYFGTAVSPANRVGGDPLLLPKDAGLLVYHRSLPKARVEKLKAEMAALRQEEKDGRAAVIKAVMAGEDPSGLFTLRDALRIFWRTGAIEGQLEKVDDQGRALPLAMGVLDREQIVDVPLLKRGEISQPGETVPRGFPDVLKSDDASSIPSDSSGRLELARWLTSRRHPLTARVMVNRIWSHVFGAGLVPTVDDFGSTGKPPSHPELLDHLAIQFVENGWSVKTMVRQLVLSRTYRQASTYSEAAFLKDPKNRLLWRMSKRRLDAEAIRDAMLSVSGELDLARPEASLVGRLVGDRPISLIGLDKRLPKDLDSSPHRSVYLPVIRDRLPDVLELFDFAEPGLVSGQRDTTNVPTQALYLMNSEFVLARADALAERVRREVGDDHAQQVDHVFQLCCARRPESTEREHSLAFLEPANDEGDANRRLARFCQAVLCTAEFRNLD